MTEQQYNKELLQLVFDRMNRIGKIRSESAGTSGYQLTSDEIKELPKFNKWEKDFVINVKGLLQAGITNEISPKQIAVLEKLYSRLG